MKIFKCFPSHNFWALVNFHADSNTVISSFRIYIIYEEIMVSHNSALKLMFIMGFVTVAILDAGFWFVSYVYINSVS